MNTAYDSSHKKLIENIYDVRHFRLHQQRLADLDYSLISFLEPHPITSKREIEQKEFASRILYENALIVQKLKDANDGKKVSTLHLMM